MAKLFNNVGVLTTTNAGTGSITLGAVIDNSYLTAVEAGVVNGDTCTYKLSQGLDIEIGRGTYSSAGPSWARTTVLVSKIGGVVGTAKISSVIGDEFRIVAAAEDFVQFPDNTGILDESSNEQLVFQTTASAVNFWQMTNSAVGGPQRLEAAGTDAAIAVTIASKGTDPINLEINGVTEAVLADGPGPLVSFTPGSDGGGQLGASGTTWQSLYLHAGALIDIGSGDWVLTHATGVVTASGDIRIVTAGTNTQSAVTVGGTQTLTNKTLTAPVASTIELGNATDTTLARINPGVVTIEGVTIATSSNTLTLTNKTFDANGTGNSITNIEAADIAAAALVTAADTIAANDNDTSWPTTAAVIDYVTATAGQTPWSSNIDANLFNLLFDDNTGILDQAANEQLIFQSAATAVNFWQMTNSAANGVQRLEAAGADASIAITIASKGTDPINFEVNSAIEMVLDANSLSPAVNAGSALGSTGLQWSNLFLSTGSTINFLNGDWLATHSAGVLTVATGDDLRMTTAGTNALSVVVVGGTQTLTNKSLTSPIITGTPTATGATWASLGTVTTIDINGGTVDGAVIGGASAVAGTFTTITGTTYVGLPVATTTVSGISEIATAAEYRTGTDTTRQLGVAETWAAAANVTLTDAATIAVDMATFINGTVTLAGNRTLGQPTNTKVGQSGFIRIVQDGTGTRTLAYHADWKFAGGTDPVLTTTAGATDVLFYTVVAANYIVAWLHKATA